MYTFMRVKLPHIQVREDLCNIPKSDDANEKETYNKVEICYCHHLGNNIIERAVFKCDKAEPQTLTPRIYDVHAEYYRKTNKDHLQDVCLGDVPALEEWSIYLPEYTLNIPQPWYYSQDTTLAFPLFRSGSMAKVSHQYELRDKLSQLVRVRVRKSPDDPWKVFPLNHQTCAFLRGEITEHTTIPEPELWACYDKRTDEEIAWHLQCKSDDSDTDADPKARIYYIRDYVECKSKLPDKAETVKVDLDASTPCNAFFFWAENQTALKHNNRSSWP